MPLPTFPATTLDQVFTRYSFNKVGGNTYKDNKYKNRVFLKLLREKKLSGDGGPNIVHPVNLGTTFNGRSLPRNGTFTISGSSNETWSRWTWSTIIETCFVSWWDIREARGNKHKMISILDSRIDETRENMEDNIAQQLSATTKAQPDDLNTMLELVATTGEIGGLNPATAGQTTWASEVEDTINYSVEGVGRYRELHLKQTDNKAEPDVVLLPSTHWLETLSIADAATVLNQDIKTKGGTKYADLGTKVPFLLNVPVIHDPAWDTAQTTTGLSLDLSSIHLVVDPAWDMYMSPFKDMIHDGRLGQAAVQIEVAQNTMSSRRAQGLMTNLG